MSSTTRVVRVAVHVVATPLDDALGSEALIERPAAAIERAVQVLRLKLTAMLRAGDACTVIIGSSVEEEP